MAPEQTEALLVTDRRSFKYPRIVLGEHEIKWKKSIKYLGRQLNRRLSFGEHLQIATAKAIQCGAALTRLMPNIGGPREAKRRLVASVVNAKLLNAAPIWTNALNNHAILKKLFLAQKGVVMRIVSAYRTVSTSAVLVLASISPIDLLAEERRENFQLRKESRKLPARRRPSARMEGADSSRNGRRDGMVTNPGDGHTVQCRSSPPGWIESTVKSAVTWRKRWRCFNAYLKRFKKRHDESCSYCGSLVDNAEHTLLFYARWGVAREAVGREVGAQLTPVMMVSLMLQSERKWMLIELFVTLVMKTRELDGRVERGNNEGQ